MAPEAIAKFNADNLSIGTKIQSDVTGLFPNSMNGLKDTPNGRNGRNANGNNLESHHIKGHNINGHEANGHEANGLKQNVSNGINGHGIKDYSDPDPALIGQNGNMLSDYAPHGTLDGTLGGEISDIANGPIAICGMACRLPGGLHTPQQLWDFLVSKGDARSRVPESRYNVSSFYDPSGRPGTVNTEHGYFLDVDLTKVDGAFSSFARGSLERMDPHQLQMMEVARECIEDAGVTGWRGDLIGCYIGSFGEDWIEMNAKESQPYGVYRTTGCGDFMLSNHVSFEMDLRGPSMTFRTACSAAMVALHEACVAIGRGDCSSAVVGGVNLILAPGMTQAMSEQGVLAPDGSCKTFSADADGYGRGEAVSAVYIKPLHAAIRDGNPVRAIIKQTATNADGRTPGLSVPSTESHEALIRKAYELAGITDFSDTQFVECHGTGTPTGDPIEANAVARVFGGTERGVYIGSVKPNLGHSEGASGLTSVIKMVMALENRVIPPNIKFNKPNPKIPFGACNLKVPLEATPWPDKAKERASINSFGIGGTNAHVILESARTYGVGVTTTSPTKNGLAASTLGSVENARDGHHLLLYSSNSSGSLQKTVDAYETFVASNPSSVAQLAYTLANGREHLSYRSFAVATSDGEVSAGPLQRTPTHDSSVIMIFTGQGAQWVAMGASLLRGSASSASIFQASIRSLDRHLRETLITPPEWSLEQQLLAVGKNSRLHLAEVSQPLCAAVQIGLVDMLAYVGVKPAAVVGHSSGEIAAAYAAGALTAGDAIIVAWLRGVAAKKQQRQGSMAAIGLGWDEVKPYLAGTTAVVACENSPNSVTISGDTPAVETVVNKIKQSPPDGQQEVLARLLKIDKAYHSHHMAEVGEDYQTALEEHQVIGRKGPRSCLFYSSVTGKLLQAQEALGAEYWRHNLESPVLFSTAVSQLLLDPEFKQSKAPVFVEVGPHSAMAGPLRQILAKASVSWPYVATMIRSQNCVNSYLTAVGRLHQLNVAINLRKLIPRVGNKPFVPDLPRYAWDHEQSAWWEPRASKEWRSRKYPYHELLGLRTTESTDFEPAWRNLLHVEHSPWIRDHIIVDDVVFPFSGYVAMAAEAIRQISKVQDGYALRHVIVSSALVVPEGKPLELLTTLRPVRLTDSLDSAWWEFTIASHNGATWNKHCTGQVRALDRSEGGKRTLMSSDGAAKDMPRLLKTRRAYSIMREFGLCYGPQFQSLQDIKAGTMEKSAAAHVVAPKLDESGSGGGSGGRRQQQPYHIHPIIIDACLQILSISATKGFTAPLGMILPTLIEEIEVYRTPADVDIISHAYMDGLGAITGSAQCSADGEVVLRMSGARLSPLAGEEPAGAVKDAHSTAVYKWSPVVDLVDMSTLVYTTEDDCRRGYMSILDDMTSMCVVYTNRRLQALHTELQSMARYATWIREQSSRADPSILRMEDWQLFDAIGYRLRDLRGTPAAGASMAMFKIITSVTAIFQGRGSALDALLADESLAQTMSLRDSGFDCSRLLRQFALSRPNMRVLELNAGMGDQTASVLRHVVLDNGQVMYSAYTYSDPSSGMLVGAKERFKSATNMQYAVLDIAQPLDSQDMAGHEQKYDIIIATNVLHGTPKLRDCLANVRELLRPNGYVLMQEFCSSSKWLNFIMGVLPRWWNGVADGRTDEPYVDLASWQSILRAAGLDTAVALADSQDKSMQQGNVLVAKHVDSFKASPAARDITLLCRHDEGDRHVETDVAKGLESEGYHVHLRSLGEQLPVGQDVIAMLDHHGPFFDGLDSHRYDALKSLAHKAATDGSGILWITSLCQMSPCQSPSYAQIFGTARTLRSEAAVALATCEVDDVSRSIAEIAQVFQRFQLALHNGADDEVLDPDYEYAISNNVVHVGRFLPFPLAEELLCHDPTDTIMLETKKPGNLAALTWARQISVPPEGNHVEVKVCASGLNFRDVLSANGIVDIPEEGLGLEASGIVTTVGPGVKDLRVGDRVFLLSRGSFSTSVTVPEELCEKIPDSLSLQDAATMPCVYATAMYSLFDVGRLRKGQSVLIHSACGGLGIAAIQLARMAGAIVYATVGSDEKARYLMDTFGMPRNHIFHSRDASFVNQVQAATQGTGVDLVLNSLSGELLHATWRCVAEFGTMVEVGKRDLLGSARLDMSVFLANRSYCCVDLDQLCFKRQSLCKSLLRRVVECYDQGHVLPIRPITVFGAERIREAFRFMQQGQHMGKIVISMRDEPEMDPATEVTEATRKQKVHFGSDNSYLLVGGLGGLGQAVSRWMVEQGVQHLVYLSRRAGTSTEDQQFIGELNSMGAKVTLVQGSVCDLADVRRAVDASPKLRGVLQMSMVLRDCAWDSMTLDEWQQATAPKIQGTWNMHEATKTIDLDFFVLFSSISGIIGQPGQANYAAANTFLDAFAQWRLSKGLATSAIDIGAVEGIGIISNNENLQRAMKTTGAYMIHEAELLEAVEAAMVQKTCRGANADRAGFVLGLASTIPLNDPNNRALWKRDTRMAAYWNISATGAGTASSSGDAIKAWLATARHDEAILKDKESVAFLAHEIGKKLFALVLRPEEEIQTSVSLAGLGMDSLVAIEMRSWWKTTFGFNISMLELLGMANLEALAAHALDEMLKTLQE